MDKMDIHEHLDISGAVEARSWMESVIDSLKGRKEDGKKLSPRIAFVLGAAYTSLNNDCNTIGFDPDLTVYERCFEPEGREATTVDAIDLFEDLASQLDAFMLFTLSRVLAGEMSDGLDLETLATALKAVEDHDCDNCPARDDCDKAELTDQTGKTIH